MKNSGLNPATPDLRYRTQPFHPCDATTRCGPSREIRFPLPKLRNPPGMAAPDTKRYNIPIDKAIIAWPRFSRGYTHRAGE